MQVLLKNWGNSVAVRLPAAILKQANLQVDQLVEVIADESGRVTIEPVKRRDFNLTDLLAQMTPENLHTAVDTGEPIGGEML
jgi:antitoxin MazE